MELDLKNFKPYSPDDCFYEVMSKFRDKAQDEYSLLDGMHKKMEASYIELGKYFAFDPKHYAMEEFFNDMKQFKDQFAHAVIENRKQREIEEKNRRAKEAKAKVEKERRERVSHKIDPTKADGMDQGLMEHLLNSLHSGSAFAQHKRKRTKAVTPQGKQKKNCFP